MWGIASTVTSAKSQNSPHMLILTHWAVLLKTHMVINRQEWDRAIAGATKPVPFCSAHWSAQGWSRNCFTSRIKWAGTLSRVVMCHTVAFHLHKANTALRFLFNIHFILNILWIARVSATATKLFENVPQFLHIPPPFSFLPFPSISQIYKPYFCYFSNLHKQNSAYRDLWVCFLLNVFMLESFICTKSWNRRPALWIKGFLINVLHVIEIYVILNFPPSSCGTAEWRYKKYPHNKLTLCSADVINCFWMSFRPECNTDNINT